MTKTWPQLHNLTGAFGRELLSSLIVLKSLLSPQSLALEAFWAA